MSAPRHALPLGLLLGLYLLLATVYSVTTPVWETPDEPGHVGYILHLIQTRRLPVQTVPITTPHAHHTPLYYGLVALAGWWIPGLDDPLYAFQSNPNGFWWDGGPDVHVAAHRTAQTFPYAGQALLVHVGRVLSILMGAGTVLLIFLSARLLFPAHLWLALLATGAVAFSPQFLFISAAVNNDNLLTLAATAAVWRVLHGFRRPERMGNWWLVGVLLSGAVLAKFSGVVVAGGTVAFVAVALILLRGWAHSLRVTLALGLTLLLLTGWWLLRNWLLYEDALGWAIYREAYPNVRDIRLSGDVLRHFFTTQFNSFWGLFGWMNVWAPGWFYGWTRLLSLLAVIGLPVFLLRQWRNCQSWQRTGLLFLAGLFLGYEGYMLWSITKFNESWYQGRYLFPVIGPLFLLGSAGLYSLLPARLRAAGVTGLLALMLAIAAYMPAQIIAPAYANATVTQPKWSLWFVPNRVDYRFADLIALRGYDVTFQPDTRQAEVTLIWQALQRPNFNYSAFVHLIDASDAIVVQQDAAPGEAVGYPPAAWWPQDILAARTQLTVPEERTGEPLRVRVGLYNWQTGEPLPIWQADELLGNFLVLDAAIP